MAKKEIIALLLAGGQGSRLGVLTQNIAKPAVPFAGEYRLIDFSLSNCSNSGIDTVGVLTQYKPFILNTHIGIGSCWDLDGNKGGVAVLPPYMKEKGGEWYQGTASAVYHNIDYIERYNPEYILILSGDHIYKMDYSLMLEFHKKKEADVSIAVRTVPWAETSRFGIINTNDQQQIIEFQEKPKKAKSNLASMGIYIFSWSKLKKYLMMPKMIDFGKDIIPAMLRDNSSLYGYHFQGYWQDVGTISSYWQSHLELLADNNKLDLYDSSWPIYSVKTSKPPQYIAERAQIKQSLVGEGCRIAGLIKNSVLAYEVIVEEGSIIKDSVIMPNVKIGKNSVIEKAIISSNVQIGDNCRIGHKSKKDITVIPENMAIS